jgi:hypothetical protein
MGRLACARLKCEGSLRLGTQPSYDTSVPPAGDAELHLKLGTVFARRPELTRPRYRDRSHWSSNPNHVATDRPFASGHVTPCRPVTPNGRWSSTDWPAMGRLSKERTEESMSGCWKHQQYLVKNPFGYCPQPLPAPAIGTRSNREALTRTTAN